MAAESLVKALAPLLSGAPSKTLSLARRFCIPSPGRSHRRPVSWRWAEAPPRTNPTPEYPLLRQGQGPPAEGQPRSSGTLGGKVPGVTGLSIPLRLRPFTSYKLRLKATNDIGDSDFSAETEAVTTLQDGECVGPGVGRWGRSRLLAPGERPHFRPEPGGAQGTRD